MSATITDAVKAELVRHRISKSKRFFLGIKCECGISVMHAYRADANSAFGSHVAREVWKNVDLPLVNSAQELANLVPGSIVINAAGDSLTPKTENPGPDNDEEIFATRGPLRILAGGPKGPASE